MLRGLLSTTTPEAAIAYSDLRKEAGMQGVAFE